MTLDGFCDHTAVSPDDAVHDHYTKLLNEAGDILYGRITYQLMEDYWPTLIENPSGHRSMDEFAQSIDRISKVVFSHTLKQVNWRNTRLAKSSLEEEIEALKQKPGKPVFIGSPGLIAAAVDKKLVDELQIMIHPVVAGKGLPLFKNIGESIDLKLTYTKQFECGAIILYYELIK